MMTGALLLELDQQACGLNDWSAAAAAGLRGDLSRLEVSFYECTDHVNELAAQLDRIRDEIVSLVPPGVERDERPAAWHALVSHYQTVRDLVNSAKQEPRPCDQEAPPASAPTFSLPALISALMPAPKSSEPAAASAGVPWYQAEIARVGETPVRVWQAGAAAGSLLLLAALLGGRR